MRHRHLLQTRARARLVDAVDLDVKPRADPLRTLIFAATVLALGLLARPSAARPAELSIPEGCGSAQEFELEVERRLGTGTKIPNNVKVELAPQGSGYRLQMLVGAERRELEDADCRALFRAAVVITVALTLSETREQPRAEPAPAPMSAAPEIATPAEPAPRIARGPEIALGLGGGVNFGLLPQPSPQLELLGKLGFWPFGVALNLRYLTPSDRRDDNGRGVSVQALGGELAALYRLGLFEASLAASAHLLLGSGLGEGKRDDSAWAIGPAAGLTFMPFQNSWMWLGVGGELYWNVQSPEFEILKYGTIFSSSTVSGSLFLRVGPRFP